MESMGEWRVIDEFPMYVINRDGVVKNTHTNYIKKPSVGKRGYLVYSMHKDKHSYLRTLHIMLARAFLPNPKNLPQVNHIDGDKLNNSLSNLEWCTGYDNVMHARNTGLHLTDGDKAVVQCLLDGTPIKVYRSISEASRETGISRGAIGNVASKKKKYKTAGGYIWNYV